MATSKSELKELVDSVKALEKKVMSLEKDVRGLRAAPKSSGDSGGLKEELARVASLVDRIVQIIKSPTERITDRNLRF